MLFFIFVLYLAVTLFSLDSVNSILGGNPVKSCQPKTVPEIKEWTVPVGKNITLTCPEDWTDIVWELSTVEKDGQIINGTQVHLDNATYVNVGFYNCINSTNDLCRAFRYRNYLYVSDDNKLSLMNTTIYSADLIFTQNTEITIPCRPTASDVNVDLFVGKTVDRNLQVKILLGENNTMYRYKPYEGFRTNDTRVPSIKVYTCEFSRNSIKESLTSRIIIIPSSISLPTPSTEDVISQTSVGERIIVGCRLETEKDISFQWLTPHMESDDRIEIFTKNRNFIPSNVTASWLTIDEVELTDAGIYYCIAKYKDDDFDINSIEISVYNKGQYFLNLLPDEEKTIFDLFSPKGVSVEWHIRFNGYPKPDLTWLKDGKELQLEYSEDSRKFFTNATSSEAVLKIVNVSRTDFGKYTLVAENFNDRKEEDINFNTIENHDVRIQLVNLDKGLVECVAAAYPKPSIYWYFKECYDESCSFVNKTNEKQLIKNGLQITSRININSSWSGWLKCVANNSVIEDVAIQEIQDMMDDFEISASNIVNFEEGSHRVDVIVQKNFTLTCSASVYNYSNTMKWFYNEQDLNQDSYSNVQIVMYDKMYSNHLVLTIFNISKDNEGSYRCEVLKKNSVPRSEITLVIVGDEDVPISPNVSYTNMNEDMEVELYDTFKLHCNFSGFPSPNISWLKDNITLSSSKRYKIIDYNQTLAFNNFTEDDVGLYKCEGFNNKGKDSRAINLRVKSTPLEYYWFIILALILALLLTFVFTVIKARNERKLKNELNWMALDNFEEGALDKLNPELELTDQADILPYNKKWEIPVENLKIGKKLGSGFFGVVMKGELIDKEKGNSIEVAVKTVNKSAGFACLKALASELKVMVHLGTHLNIVNLLGACTKNITKRELFVIVEYCRYGNLQHYLLHHKRSFVNQVNCQTGQVDYSIEQDVLQGCDNKSNPNKSLHLMKYVTLAFDNEHDCEEENTSTSGIVSTDEEEMESSYYRGDYRNDVRHIYTKDLIAWSFQIACGMEYLASRKVLHGDLAARNILLSENDVVKICDFGLSKNMYYSDIYKKSDHVPLPVKWMAIEAIIERIFSTQSDVWAFGVVLWELFSLGNTPYPLMKADEAFAKRLLAGYRMDRPKFAPKELYKTMLDCWHADPLKRPSFTKLSERIGAMLEDPVKNHYLEMNDTYISMNNKARSDSDQDYLSMMKAPNFECVSLPRHNYVNVPPSSESTSGYASMDISFSQLKDKINNSITEDSVHRFEIYESDSNILHSEDDAEEAGLSNPNYYGEENVISSI